MLRCLNLAKLVASCVGRNLILKSWAFSTIAACIFTRYVCYKAVKNKFGFLLTLLYPNSTVKPKECKSASGAVLTCTFLDGTFEQQYCMQYHLHCMRVQVVLMVACLAIISNEKALKQGVWKYQVLLVPIWIKYWIQLENKLRAYKIYQIVGVPFYTSIKWS